MKITQLQTMVTFEWRIEDSFWPGVLGWNGIADTMAACGPTTPLRAGSGISFSTTKMCAIVSQGTRGRQHAMIFTSLERRLWSGVLTELS